MMHALRFLGIAAVALGYAVAASAQPVPSSTVTLGPGTATIGKVDQGAPGATPWPVTEAQLETNTGAPGATACATDTASCNFNQLFQRIAQRLTTINTTLGTPMQATGGTVGLVAGTAIAGKFGIDQTTPGTTNAVVDTGNVASGATDSGNPVKVGGVYNSTSPTLTTGQRGDAQVDTRANLLARNVTLNSTAADGFVNSSTGFATASTLITFPLLEVHGNYVFNGTTWDRLRGTTNGLASVPSAGTTSGASFLNVAAGQATTTVKSGAGTLYAIVLNSAATATNVTTVYDNTAGSGTVIAIPAVTTATIPMTLSFGPTGLAFATGLTVVTATANGGNMTFVYK